MQETPEHFDDTRYERDARQLFLALGWVCPTDEEEEQSGGADLAERITLPSGLVDSNIAFERMMERRRKEEAAKTASEQAVPKTSGPLRGGFAPSGRRYYQLISVRKGPSRTPFLGGPRAHRGH